MSSLLAPESTTKSAPGRNSRAAGTRRRQAPSTSARNASDLIERGADEALVGAQRGSAAPASTRPMRAIRRQTLQQRRGPSPLAHALAPRPSACSLIAACAVSRPAPRFTASIRTVVVARNGALRSRSACDSGGKDLHLGDNGREGLEQAVDGEQGVRAARRGARPSRRRRPRSTGRRRARRTSSGSRRGSARKPLMRSQLRELTLCGMADEPTWPSWKPSAGQVVARPSAAAWWRSCSARRPAGTAPPRPRNRGCADRPARPRRAPPGSPSERAISRSSASTFAASPPSRVSRSSCVPTGPFRPRNG